MMKNIYFFDIDNTLLDHRTHTIPESALEAITKLQAQGHTIAIATGRSYGHARAFIDPIRPSYVISMNGARILKEGREVFTYPMDRQRVVDLFAWMRAQGHDFGVNNGGCDGDSTSYISARTDRVLIPLNGVRMPVQTDDPIYLREPIYQGWLFFDEALDGELVPAIHARYPEFALVRWHRTAVDVMPRAINKWTGCQWVLQATGFSPEQAVAFGDGLNDMEMLQGVGLGIAMGNGHPDLKAVADHVAPALHHDGIAVMLAELANKR